MRKFLSDALLLLLIALVVCVPIFSLFSSCQASTEARDRYEQDYRDEIFDEGYDEGYDDGYWKGYDSGLEAGQTQRNGEQSYSNSDVNALLYDLEALLCAIEELALYPNDVDYDIWDIYNYLDYLIH